jgi:predicted dehydrogenase
LIARDDIDLVDICTSNATHEPIAIAAAKRGKAVITEKPMARNAAEARRMMHAVQEAGVINMVAFNYRRLPAIAFARQLIDEGKIGEIRHFNAVYYQDWLVDPLFPFVWRHDIKEGGSGAHGDMSAHTVDLARFLCGEFEAVAGAQSIFVKERPQAGGGGLKPVTADDATNFLARFRNGAMGSFNCSRFANGRKNFLRLEIFGSKGSLGFNLERLNELEYYSGADPDVEQGFRTIYVTAKKHPYLKAWWPDGHILGWEHTFIHEMADLMLAIDSKKPLHADFYDGYRCQLVLDAAQESADKQKWIGVPEK